MNKIEAKSWISEVTEKLPGFISVMKDGCIPGRFHYSLTGDLPKGSDWGLANTVFGVKTAYMLGKIDLINPDECSSYIKGFQQETGEICDPEIQKRSRLNRLLSSLRRMDFGNLCGVQNRRAETRQACTALAKADDLHERSLQKLPETPESVKEYVGNMEWNCP